MITFTAQIPRTTFMDGFMLGDIHPDEIDDYIHDWHSKLTHEEELYEFLGMTRQEYADWVEGRSLEDIRFQRKVLKRGWPYTWLNSALKYVLDRLIPHP